jgi:hypothetical protein
MVGQVVNDLRRGQAVVLKLFSEFTMWLSNHP